MRRLLLPLLLALVVSLAVSESTRLSSSETDLPVPPDGAVVSAASSSSAQSSILRDAEAIPSACSRNPAIITEIRARCGLYVDGIALPSGQYVGGSSSGSECLWFLYTGELITSVQVCKGDYLDSLTFT